MPTPSLNSASPCISTSSRFEMETWRSVLITATGSVGLISAPNTSAHASGSGWPMRSETSQTATPTSAVDTVVPINASAATGQARSRNRCRSRFSAPAKIRKASIPFITTSVKSIRCRLSRSVW